MGKRDVIEIAILDQCRLTNKLAESCCSLAVLVEDENMDRVSDTLLLAWERLKDTSRLYEQAYGEMKNQKKE